LNRSRLRAVCDAAGEGVAADEIVGGEVKRLTPSP
jgi:hypothetical protein